MKLLREYFELCDGGICQDLLTEDEKKRVAEGKVTILSGVMQMSGRRSLIPYRLWGGQYSIRFFSRISL